MKFLRLMAVCAAAAVALLTAAARADDAQVTFDSLYGADLKRVAASSDPRDDVELAVRMVADAKKSAAQPELLTLQCEKAHQLAAKTPAGYPAAVEAMELLAEKVPAKEAACRDKLIALHQARMSSAANAADRQAAGEDLVDLYQDAAEDKAQANEWPAASEFMRKASAIAESIHSAVRDQIRARLNELVARERLEREITDLKSKLKANENDAIGRERLVRIYLIDLDKPEEAAKYVTPAIADEGLRTYVPLAAKPADGLDETVVKELAGWYRGLAEKAPTAAQPPLYERAKTYYTTFLAKHTAEDMDRTQAKLALDGIEAALARLAVAPDAPGWVDVLPLVDVNKHCFGGKWQRQDQKLSVTATDFAKATIPVLPDGSYQLQVKFTRTDGTGPVVVALPVASAACALVLSANNGAVGGLHLVGDKPVEDNAATTRPSKLDNGKEYTLDIKVMARGKQQSITAMLNGQKCVQWEGAAGDLSLGQWSGLLAPRALGLAARDDTVTFASVRLRLLSGAAQTVADNTGKPDAAGTGGGGGPGGWGNGGNPFKRGVFGRGFGGGGGRRGKGG